MAVLSKEEGSIIRVKNKQIPLTRMENLASTILKINVSNLIQIVTLTNEVKKFQEKN